MFNRISRTFFVISINTYKLIILLPGIFLIYCEVVNGLKRNKFCKFLKPKRTRYTSTSQPTKVAQFHDF